MEHQKPGKLCAALGKIPSLNELSPDVVDEIRQASGQSIVLGHYSVTDYYEWLKKGGSEIRGVEFDAQNSCLTIKGKPGWMQEAAIGVLYVFFDKLRDALSAATGLRYFLDGEKIFPLHNYLAASTKHANASVTKDQTGWPTVVLGVGGLSEFMFEIQSGTEAQRWIDGCDGNTKLAVLVNIHEEDSRDTTHDKWQLSQADCRKMSFQALRDHISRWYRKRGIHLVGRFTLSVHLCYSDGDSQVVLDKITFSPGSLVDFSTIQDIPLRMNHLMPNGCILRDDKPLLFPTKTLVDVLQHSFEDIEIERIDQLAKEKKEECR